MSGRVDELRVCSCFLLFSTCLPLYCYLFISYIRTGAHGKKKLPVFLTDTLNHRLLGGSPNSVDSHYYGIAPEIKFGFPRIGQFVHV